MTFGDITLLNVDCMAHMATVPDKFYELAIVDPPYGWISHDRPAKVFDYPYYGNIEGTTKAETRIHPTMKPVALYKWLLKNYAKEGDKILDTHGGSMSIAIACADYGFKLDLCELDKDYYDAGVKRFKNHIAQQKLFV